MVVIFVLYNISMLHNIGETKAQTNADVIKGKNICRRLMKRNILIDIY